MREFIKSFFSFGLATTIEKLIAFMLIPIYTRFFTKVEFGVIDLIQVVLGMASIFAVLQLESALQRYYYEFEGRTKKVYISTIFFVIVVLSLSVALILTIFSSQISLLIFKTANYSTLIKLASWQLPLTNFSMIGYILLRYEKENVRFVLLIATKVAMSLISVMIFVVWLKQGINGVFYAQLIGLAASTTFLFFSIRKFLVLEVSSGLFTRSIQYALPFFPARVGSVLLSYANRFFMVGYLTIASIGLYSLSLKLASAIQLVYSAFIMAWAPFMFEQLKKPSHKALFPRVLLLVASPVFLLVALIALFSKELVLIIASAEFQESYHYVGGLSLYFSLFIFKEIVDIGPKHMEKTKYLSYTFFMSVIINVVSLYVFIRIYGIYGVVYSMLITNTFLLIVSWVVSNRLYFIPFSVVKFVLLALPAYILSIGSMYGLPSLSIRVLISLMVIGIYGFAFWKYYTSFKNQNINDSNLNLTN